MTLATEFNFYGVGVKVTSLDSTSEEVFQRLKKDFSFASVKSNGEPEISINLTNSTQQNKSVKKLGKRLFKTSFCNVYGKGGDRVCDYGEGTQIHAVNSRNKRSFEIFSKSETLLYEVTYLLILSSVGESLDLKGYHRIHGLGFSAEDKTYLLVLPSGGGKSALATLLRKQKGIKFFSDEIPLVKKGVMYSFPLRVALHPKVAQHLGVNISDKQTFKRKVYPEKILIPWKMTEVEEPRKIDHILIGRVGEPEITSAHWGIAFKGFFQSMVLGLGVPQMAEHMLRFDSTCHIPTIGLSRLRESLKAVSQAKTFNFYLGSKIEANFEVLWTFLQKSKN